jgi:hypothetical protein
MAGLFNSTVLDVAIGLVFVYLLLAILCTAANEWIAALLKTRSNMLKEGIAQLLDKQATNADKSDVRAFIQEFYKHPLITGMMRGKKDPTYLSAETFAAAVTDIIASGKEAATTLEGLKHTVNEFPPGDVQKALSALLRRSGGNLETAQKAIEGWFNDAMDRVTGWYKRRTVLWTVIIAAVLTILSNADTVQIARRLWTDPVLRSKVVAEAQNRAKKPPPTVEYPDKDEPTEPKVTEGNSVSAQEQQLLTQILGWQGNPRDDSFSVWLSRLLGWLLTILAVSLGAPFWFDMLNKLINIRSAGKSPDEEAKKPKKKLPPANQAA